jgi:chromosome segregation ATPase
MFPKDTIDDAVMSMVGIEDLQELIQAKDKQIASLKQDKDELQTTINAMLEAKKAYVELVEGKDKEISALKNDKRYYEQEKEEINKDRKKCLNQTHQCHVENRHQKKEIKELRAKLGEAVKIIKVLSCGKSSQDEILLTFHDADQFLKSLEGEKKKEGV